MATFHLNFRVEVEAQDIEDAKGIAENIRVGVGRMNAVVEADFEGSPTEAGARQAAYVPRGRTDESSFDYTDDPRQLASRFDRRQLQEALDDTDTEASSVVLKFDYEEYVPREAVVEALELAKKNRWSKHAADEQPAWGPAEDGEGIEADRFLGHYMSVVEKDGQWLWFVMYNGSEARSYDVREGAEPSEEQAKAVAEAVARTDARVLDEYGEEESWNREDEVLPLFDQAEQEARSRFANLRKQAGYYVDGVEYRYVDPERNSNKYYRIWTTSDRPEWAAVQWGRIGTDGQCLITNPSDAERKLNSKIAKGYEYQTTYSPSFSWSSDLENQDSRTINEWLNDVANGTYSSVPRRGAKQWLAQVVRRVEDWFRTDEEDY